MHKFVCAIFQRPLIESTFGADFPTSHRLRRRMSLLFVNSNAFLEFGRPLSHKVVYIGGLVDAIGSSDAKLEQAGIFLFKFNNKFKFILKILLFTQL